MCKWGTSTVLEVTVPAHLCSAGEARRKTVDVDSCIAPLVSALNDADIPTIASCCGHGHLPPSIAIEWEGDTDRWLMILTRAEMERVNAAYGVDIHGTKSFPECDVCMDTGVFDAQYCECVAGRALVKRDRCPDHRITRVPSCPDCLAEHPQARVEL